MSEHLHETFIPGCFRCDLGLDEVGDGGRVVIRTGDLRALAAAQAEVKRLNTWDGLLSVLDEHYPAEVFEKSSDPGARIVTLTRALAAAREENEGLVKAAAALLEESELIFLSCNDPDDEDTPWPETIVNLRAALAREATDADR